MRTFLFSLGRNMINAINSVYLFLYTVIATCTRRTCRVFTQTCTLTHSNVHYIHITKWLIQIKSTNAFFSLLLLFSFAVEFWKIDVRIFVIFINLKLNLRSRKKKFNGSNGKKVCVSAYMCFFIDESVTWIPIFKRYLVLSAESLLPNRLLFIIMDCIDMFGVAQKFTQFIWNCQTRMPERSKHDWHVHVVIRPSVWVCFSCSIDSNKMKNWR